jgi:WD40 repeat protein
LTRTATRTGDDHTAILWNVPTGQLLRRFTGHAESVFSVAFSPNAQRVLTGSWDKTARLWEVETQREVRSFGRARNAFYSVAVSPDGQRIAGGTYWKVDPVPSFRYGLFTIQIGSFRDPNNASRLKDRMQTTYQSTQIVPFSDADGTRYRVQVGSYQDLLLAQEEMKRLRSNGFADAFVVAREGK